MEEPGIENITKAVHDMGFVCDDIRYSHKHATITESMVLEGLAGTANELRIRLERFNDAINENDT